MLSARCSGAGRDALKLKVLRMHIKAGVEALERGDFTEVDDGELDTWLDACQALD